MLAGDKVTAHRHVTFPDDLPDCGPRSRGTSATGYEIRVGRTSGDAPLWASGRVLATTVHGLLEDPDIVERLVGRRPRLVLDDTFDLLADAVEEHLDTGLLRRLSA